MIGDRRPWPRWVHTDAALVQAAAWLRSYHALVENFRPPAEAVWREGGQWEPGLIIGHSDAAPCNVAWVDQQLVGFFDWDFAGPVTREWDVAFVAFAWVPLHARHVVEQEGFTDLGDRPRRLRLFLDTYGWHGPLPEFIPIVQDRIRAAADGIHRLAAAGDTAYQQMIMDGVDENLRAAASELNDFRAHLAP